MRCIDDVLLDRVGMHSRVEEPAAALFRSADGVFELPERAGAKQAGVLTLSGLGFLLLLTNRRRR